MTKTEGGRLIPAIFMLTALFATWRLSRRYSRYEVSGTSMEPAYGPGDWLLVDRYRFQQRPPRVGEVVVAADPREPSRRIIKRVYAVSLHQTFDLRGDNPTESTDSRVFGLVAREQILGGVVGRFPAPFSS